MKKTSTLQNGLIWFGAGVSLAEILTGASFAPLGMARGFAILKRDRFGAELDIRNLVIWTVGFAGCRVLMRADLTVGCTLADMVLTILLCLLAEKLTGGRKRSG